MQINKPLKIAVYTLLGLVVVALLIQVTVSQVLSNKVDALLSGQDLESYRVSVDKVNFSLLHRSISIEGFKLIPKDSVLQKVKERKTGAHSAEIISSSSMRLKDIRFLEALLHKNYVAGGLEVEDLLITYLQMPKEKKSVDSATSGPLRLDSIRLNGLEGLELGQINMRNLKLQVIDLESGRLTFENKPVDFDINGFKLEQSGDGYFALKPLGDQFTIANLSLELADKHYRFSVDHVKMDFNQNVLLLRGLNYKPTIDITQLASTYTYNDDVFDISIASVTCYRPSIGGPSRADGVYIDSIVLDAPDIRIFKDKNKPFNTAKRPGLVYDQLKRMDFQFLVKTLRLTNGSLHYEEDLPHASDNMVVSMKDLDLSFDNLTSIAEHRIEPLRISMRAKFMNEAPLELHVDLPLEDGKEVFHFSGRLHSSSFRLYDQAIFPALGVKVLEGTLHDLNFMAKANAQSSSGTMTMRYSDLKTEVSRINSDEKSGFLSWSVNQVVHKSNPGITGKLRVAIMDFERTPYKGLGNYLWKTVESGIINTVSPVGHTVEKEEARKNRQLRRAEKKKKKELSS